MAHWCESKFCDLFTNVYIRPVGPEIVFQSQASVFVPGKAEGAAAASGPRFFVPGGTSSSQVCTPILCMYSHFMHAKACVPYR